MAAEFRRLGAVVIDADRLAHEALELESVRKGIAARFGPDTIGPDGSIDRAALGRQAFASREAMSDLEAIVHPVVLEAIERRLERAATDPEIGLAVLDAPLLIETGLDRACNRIAFVDAPFESRLERVKQSREWDLAELERREKLQKPLKEKKRRADFTIGNDRPTRSLQASVQEIWNEIARPAARHAPSRSPHSSPLADPEPLGPAEGIE